MIVYTGLAILSAPLYLRYLGVSQYGIFVLLNSTIAPLGLLNMGMGQAAVKFMAAAIARKDAKEANAFLQATFITTGALGLLGVIAVILGAHLLTSHIFRLDAADQRIAYLSIPWVSVTWLLSQLGAQFTAVPSAMQRYNISSTGSTIFGAVVLGTGLLPLWMGGGLLAVLKLRCVAMLVTTIIWLVIAKVMMPSLTVRRCVTRATFSKCMNFGIWQMVASVGSVAGNNADKALLGMYVSDGAVGLFAIPQTIVDRGYSLISRAADVLVPAISEIDSQTGRGRSLHVALRAGWILSLINTAIMGSLAIMGDDTLRLYVGKTVAKSSGHLLLPLIALTAVAGSSTVAISQYLLGIADTKRTAVLCITSGIVNTVGCALLIPKFGLNGAAWADVVAIVLVRPWILRGIWRDNGRELPWREFASYLYGPALIGIPLSLVLHLVRNAISWECGWLGFGAAILGCSITLILGVILFDRVLPGWRQRRLDAGEVLRHVCGQLTRLPVSAKIAG